MLHDICPLIISHKVFIIFSVKPLLFDYWIVLHIFTLLFYIQWSMHLLLAINVIGKYVKFVQSKLFTCQVKNNSVHNVHLWPDWKGSAVCTCLWACAVSHFLAKCLITEGEMMPCSCLWAWAISHFLAKQSSSLTHECYLY